MNPEKTPAESPLHRYLEIEQAVASELAVTVAEQQATMYETAALTLMRRTGENTELIHSMRDFVAALGNKALFGVSDKPLSASQQADLKTFFDGATDRLNGRKGQEYHTGWTIINE